MFYSICCSWVEFILYLCIVVRNNIETTCELINVLHFLCYILIMKPRVKPRMDFPDQFSKIFLAYQPFPSAPTRKFEAFMPSCPQCKHNKLTINHLYANGKNNCSHSYPHALTTFSRKISHSILFINHILSFL